MSYAISSVSQSLTRPPVDIAVRTLWFPESPFVGILFVPYALIGHERRFSLPEQDSAPRNLFGATALFHMHSIDIFTPVVRHWSVPECEAGGKSALAVVGQMCQMSDAEQAGPRQLHRIQLSI